MTDHSRYKSPSGAQLTLRRRTGDSLDLDERLFLMVDGRGMFIPTAELLAMIDAADPDAMRAYLRETVEHAYLENMGVPATERDTISESIASFKGETTEREIPEADSPEDTDERRLCDPLTDGDLADLREAGRTLGEAWLSFADAVREGARR